MQTFKEFFITENKKKNRKPIELTYSKGAKFGMVGAGKSGIMQADRKEFRKKKERKEGKTQAKRAMQGDY